MVLWTTKPYCSTNMHEIKGFKPVSRGDDPLRQPLPRPGWLRLPPIAVLLSLIAATTLISACRFSSRTPPSGEWPVYGGDNSSSRSSDLNQISRENVHQLQVA